MKRESSSATTLSFREPLGFWGWLVLPAFVAVVGFSFGPLIGVLPKMAREDVKIVAMVILFLAVAAWRFNHIAHAVFGCVGVTLDRGRGVVVTRYGLFWPRDRATHPLAGVEQLNLRRVEIRKGRHIDVWHEINANGVVIGRAREYGAARALAEEMGAFLKLEIHDYTSGDRRVIPVSELGQGLLAQGPLAEAPVPEKMSSVVERSADNLVIRPPNERTGCLKIWFGVVAVVAGILATVDYYDGRSHAQATVWGVISGILFAIGLPLIPYRERFEAGPGGLHVEQKGLLITGRSHFTAAQLTDITPGDSDVLVVSGGRTLSIAYGLSGLERAWIANELKRALVGPPK